MNLVQRKINHQDHHNVLDEADEGADPLEGMEDMDAGNWDIQDDSMARHSDSPPEPEPNAPLPHSNHSGRVIHMPRQYADFIPGDNIARPDEIMPEEEIHTEVHAGNELIPFETNPDTMGLYRIYPTCPTLFLQSPLNSLCDTPMLQPETSKGPNNTPSHLHTGPPLPISITADNLYSAFSSPTAGLLMCWQYSSSNLISDAAMQRLTTFLNNDAYNRNDIKIFNPTREKRFIAQYLEDHSNPFSARNGWKESSVYIRLPKEKMKWPS
ncbi:hypothetical protein EDB19DRAFT_1907660 [Suillus lakei]|nr:hypothetical protein EDB19DRAFT_1907660 [Suillus lakei]